LIIFVCLNYVQKPLCSSSIRRIRLFCHVALPFATFNTIYGKLRPSTDKWFSLPYPSPSRQPATSPPTFSSFRYGQYPLVADPPQYRGHPAGFVYEPSSPAHLRGTAPSYHPTGDYNYQYYQYTQSGHYYCPPR